MTQRIFISRSVAYVFLYPSLFQHGSDSLLRALRIAKSLAFEGSEVQCAVAFDLEHYGNAEFDSSQL